MTASTDQLQEVPRSVRIFTFFIVVIAFAAGAISSCVRAEPVYRITIENRIEPTPHFSTPSPFFRWSDM